MSGSKIVNDLYKFLQEGVTLEDLQASTKKAYEGKLPANPGIIADPKDDIQKLAEEEVVEEIKDTPDVNFEDIKVGGKFYSGGKQWKKESKDSAKTVEGEKTKKFSAKDIVAMLSEAKKKDPKVEIKPADITDKPQKSKIEKDMDKATPEVDKKSDAGIPNKVETKDEKKKDVKVTGVKKESVEEGKDKAGKRDGTGPHKDSKQAEDSDIGKRKEDGEICIGEKEDDNETAIKAANKSEQDAINKKAAKEGKLPKDPSEVTPDQIQTLAEEKVLTTVSDQDVARELAAKYPGSRIVDDNVDGKKQYIIMVKEGEEIKEETVEEEVTATISTDDKDVTVSTGDGTTTVTTTDNPSLDVDIDVVPDVPMEAEPVDEPLVSDDSEVMDLSDEDAYIMGEKLFLVNYLKTRKTLSEKEKQFIAEVEAIKLSEKTQELVNTKLKTIEEENK